MMATSLEPEDNLPHLRGKQSALCQVLTKAIYKKLFWSKTSSGYTVDQAIQIGVDCEDPEIGFFLGDYEVRFAQFMITESLPVN